MLKKCRDAAADAEGSSASEDRCIDALKLLTSMDIPVKLFVDGALGDAAKAIKKMAKKVGSGRFPTAPGPGPDPAPVRAAAAAAALGQPRLVPALVAKVERCNELLFIFAFTSSMRAPTKRAPRMASRLRRSIA